MGTLTSTFKLFLREMKESIITKQVLKSIKKSNVDLTGKGDEKTVISQLKKSMELLDELPYRVLHYILLHAKQIADIQGNQQKLCAKYHEYFSFL